MLSIYNEYILNRQKQNEFRQEVAADRLAAFLTRQGNSQPDQNRLRTFIGRQLVRLGQRLQ